jgi:hypothetical protein
MNEPFPDPPLRKLKIDLEDLILAFDGNGGFGDDALVRHFLDSETGEVLLLHPDMEDYDALCERIDYSKPGQFHFIEPLLSQRSFIIMETFVESLPNFPDRARLVEALSRSKPFRHFKEAIHRNLELRNQWFLHRDQAMEAHARHRLKIWGIEPEWTGFKQT